MIYLLFLALTGAVFIGIGIFALKKKTPMHFWAGTIVKSEEITDVKAYNKANGIMWIISGLLIAMSGIPAIIWNVNMVAIISVIVFMPGLIVLVLVYNKIYSKYKV